MKRRLFMRFPEGKAKALTLSYDDGVQQDARLIEILNRHGLKCTFNINSGSFAPEGKVYEAGRVHRRMTERECVELYTNSGHEVAVHAYTHPFLEQLPQSGVVYEVMKDREALESIFGCIIKGMAYPYGTLNNDVVEALRVCGISYSRTTVSTEKFDIPTDWLRLPATCHHRNPKLMELAEKFTGYVPEKMEAPKLFYLWGHSYEFEGANNWHIIENFAEYMGGREDIWYATNIQIYDYIKAYNSLEFSADMSIVHNPSALTVYFNFNGKNYTLASGETCVFEGVVRID